jgi:hypothetical protein
MNATGTERQRAIIAAYRMKPEASQAEIAAAAGVHQTFVSRILGSYLESQARDRACQGLVCPTSKPMEKDVATFVPARRPDRFDADAPVVPHTVKQQNTRIALAEHPQKEGERKMQYCRRIAAIAGVSHLSVHAMMGVINFEQIGAALRAKQAAEAGTKLVPVSAGIGPVTNFRGWLEFFTKLKMLVDGYLLVAQSRHDVFATSFLKTIGEKAERAAERATMDLE